MKIFVVLVLAILVVVYLMNRQKAQVERIRSYRRFEPDWGRTRAGSRRRRRRHRIGGLRAEMTRLEDEEVSPIAGSKEPGPGNPPTKAPPEHEDT